MFTLAKFHNSLLIRLVLGTGALLCLAAPTFAQELRLQDINPIMSFEEQAKRLNAECHSRSQDPLCEKKREQLHEVLQQLRALCREKPDDDRCGAIRRERPVSKLKQFCFENPFEYKCIRRRELHKIREKRKRRYCAKNPDAARCRSSAGKPAAYMTFVEFCRVNPKNRRCIERKTRDSRNAKEKEPEANTF